jgi:hypothetical protein
MPLPYDTDPILDSLQDDLRMRLSALNDAHHPVWPSDPRRIAELERLVRELREAIVARRREIAPIDRAPGTAESPAAQAKGPDRVGQGP